MVIDLSTLRLLLILQSQASRIKIVEKIIVYKLLSFTIKAKRLAKISNFLISSIILGNPKV